ncbi:MAG: hypothetical protein ACLFPF_04940 [Halanaerobiales bacterium]
MTKIISILVLIALIFSTLLLFEAKADTILKKEFAELDNLYNSFYTGGNLEYLEKSIDKIEVLIANHSENYEMYWRAAEGYYHYGAAIAAEEKKEGEPLSAFKKGREYAEKAVELNPDSSRAHFWLGSLMGSVGLEEGILSSLSMIKPMRNELETAIELDPEYAEAYDVLAELYNEAPGWPISIGSDKKALEYREKAVELQPRNFEYQWKLYQNYEKLDYQDEAKVVLYRILQMAKYRNDLEATKYKDIAEEQLQKYE